MNKPKLISLLVCDQVITDQNGKHTLVGIFGEINTRKFPTIHPHMVVFLAWLNKGVEKKTKLNIQILDKEGSPLDAKIENHQIEFLRDKSGTFGIFNFNNVLFREGGIYTIVVDLDDERIGELPVKVSLSNLD